MLIGEDLEDRFIQLRNQLTKKLREMRRKPPSGSGSGVKIIQWPLMGAMSFFIPSTQVNTLFFNVIYRIFFLGCNELERNLSL